MSVLSEAEVAPYEWLKYNGRQVRRVPLQELQTWPNYKGWMDILSAEKIMTYGGVPYDKLSHASVYAVTTGLKEMFGPSSVPSGDWFGKLRALFPPTGQVKNFLNAAVVAHQVHNGGRMAILGSRYAQGSGDWVHLLAHWLSEKGRSMTIHCYDPNEVAAKMVVGGVTVITLAKAVERDKLVGYDALVDDIYVAGVGYDFSLRRDAPIVSYKMYNAETIAGVRHEKFLHLTEARYFSFPRYWDNVKSPCSCERCRIEEYLDIKRFSDILSVSPCRPHIPEVFAMSVLWQEISVGVVRDELVPVYERASMLLAPLLPANVQKDPDEEPPVSVDRIFGYSPQEVPFSANHVQSPWYAVCPSVVSRPGVVVSSIGLKISKVPDRGWVAQGQVKGWTVSTRPTRPRLLLPGFADVFWGGVQVVRKKRVEIKRGEVVVCPHGKYEVQSWCFLHQTEDDCGLVTDHLDYPVCSCGHRHGDYSLSQWGVVCGRLPIKSHEDVLRFLTYRTSKMSTIDSFSDLVMRVEGDPVRIANYCIEHGISNMSELLVAPSFYLVSGRWWYYPWELFKGKIGFRSLSKADFIRELNTVSVVPWPVSVLHDPATPVRIVSGKFSMYSPG